MVFIELKSGTSVEGAEIKAYKTEKKGNRYLYLMAGVHGDEVEGVYLLQQLFNWLKDEDDLDLPIVVIPVLNVDGYRLQTRGNSHGVDLNRNYPSNDWTKEYSEKKYYPGPSPLSEPENVFLVKLFEKFPPYFILSFHSWKPMLNFNGKCKEMADFLNCYNSYPVAADISYPTPGSLGEFGPEKFNSPVLTFECPLISEGATLTGVWDENEEGLKNLLKSKLVLPN